MKPLLRYALTLVFLLLAHDPVAAQALADLVIACPEMPIRNVSRPGRYNLWQTDKIECAATVTFRDGKTLTISNSIPKTFVRKHGLQVYVDACVATGESNGWKLVVNLKRERVVKTGIGVMTAQAITCAGTLTGPDGQIGVVSVTYPDCRARGNSRVRVAEAVTAVGKVTIP